MVKIVKKSSMINVMWNFEQHEAKYFSKRNAQIFIETHFTNAFYRKNDLKTLFNLHSQMIAIIKKKDKGIIWMHFAFGTIMIAH